VRRIATLALLCRADDASRFQPLPFVLPWEPMADALGSGLPPQAVAAQLAARSRGTHALHVDGAMRWHCFDREFRDLSGAHVTQPHRWRRPLAGGHRLVHRALPAGGTRHAPAPAARPAAPAVEEEPPLPALVRELRRMRTLQAAGMLVGGSGVAQLLPQM